MRSLEPTSEGKEAKPVLASINNQFWHSGARYQRDSVPWPALGTINVIFARPMGDVGTCSRVIFVVGGFDPEDRN